MTQMRIAAEENELNGLYGMYVKNTLLLYSKNDLWSFEIRACVENYQGIRLETCEHESLKELLETVWRKTRRYDTVYAIYHFRTLMITNNQNISRYVHALFQQFREAGQEDIEKLFSELYTVVEQISQIEFMRWLAGNIAVQFSMLNIFSGIEAAEFMMNIEKEETVEGIQERLTKLIEKARQSIEQSRRSYGSIARTVTEYVGKHLSDQNMTLKDIAENHLFMNVDYVSRQFQKETGERFSQYLTEQRIQKAKALLSEKNVKVQYVAEMVGCGGNPQYFSQIFKKATGMPPSRWMQIMQEKN